ncbi:MAG: hypothetical protein R6X29_01265 [Acidimicrobiia bacterium]|jgi:hypothetical protein
MMRRMGKRMRLLAGIAVGAAVQYLTDPQMGRARRAWLSYHLAARARDARAALHRETGEATDQARRRRLERIRRVEGAREIVDDLALA